MANTLLTPTVITKEALRLYRNANSFLKAIDHQYDDQFARSGGKIGNQLRIRVPIDVTPRRGQAASFQDVSEQFVTLTIANQAGADMQFSQPDLTLTIDNFAERYIAPAVNVVTAVVAADIMSGAEGGVSNYVDNQAAGVIISPSAQTFLTANAILAARSAPMGRHRVVVNQYTEAKVVGALAGLFNPQSRISQQYNDAEMVHALGLDWFMDQTVISHTSGSFTAGTVNGANQSGSTLVTNAITGTLKKGDHITIAGVNAINRLTKLPTGKPAQFTVTADVATGATSVPIYPPLIGAGANGVPVQYQTADVAAANGAAITLLSPASSTYLKNIVFVPEAITMVTADLAMPGPGAEGARQHFDGVSMLMAYGYNIQTGMTGWRLDVLWGSLWIRPEWCVTVADSIN